MQLHPKTAADDTPLSERQSAILGRIAEQGFVTLDALADAFGVSMQTVRRDLNALAESGLVERFHGGAGLCREALPQRRGHAQKRVLAVEEKQRIAAAAAALVGEGAHVFLDVGTTAEALAVALDAGPPLTVVTNSLHVAGLVGSVRHRVRVLPGFVAGEDGSLVGAETLAALARLRLDHAFLSCSGIEPDGRVMDWDADKIAIKKAALAVARTRVLLATTEKLGRTAREEMARLADFDHVITDPARDEGRSRAPSAMPSAPDPREDVGP